MAKKKKPAKPTTKTEIIGTVGNYDMVRTTIDLKDVKVRILPPIKIKLKP